MIYLEYQNFFGEQTYLVGFLGVWCCEGEDQLVGLHYIGCIIIVACGLIATSNLLHAHANSESLRNVGGVLAPKFNVMPIIHFETIGMRVVPLEIAEAYKLSNRVVSHCVFVLFSSRNERKRNRRKHGLKGKAAMVGSKMPMPIGCRVRQEHKTKLPRKAVGLAAK